jgi:glycosyltransferase involved in cell wall biosynthesis
MDLSPGALWLDARGIQSTQHAERGIARYVTEHIHALLELAPELVGRIGLDPDLPIPASLEHLEGSGKLGWHSRGRPDVDPAPFLYHVMSPFERAIELDDIWPDWARDDDVRTVVTLYDLIPLVFREEYLTHANWGSWGTAWVARLGLIRAADQVLTISRRTADDAIERIGITNDQVTVIDSGVSGSLASLAGSSAANRRLRPGFLLYVGGDEPRKNLEGTIRAFGLLPEPVRLAHQLVITCKLPLLRRAQLMAFARRLGIRQRDLVLTGFVPDPELAALYRSCELFVFPSLYEGAGLPILEAMSCGAPVVASRTSSIPEILGDPEGTFDPADPADIARCLDEVLGDAELLERLRDRSRERVGLFTWERVAERTLEGYERALEVSKSPSAA